MLLIFDSEKYKNRIFANISSFFDSNNRFHWTKIEIKLFSKVKKKD
jgi:hypothetical protein